MYMMNTACPLSLDWYKLSNSYACLLLLNTGKKQMYLVVNQMVLLSQILSIVAVTVTILRSQRASCIMFFKVMFSNTGERSTLDGHPLSKRNLPVGCSVVLHLLSSCKIL